MTLDQLDSICAGPWEVEQGPTGVFVLADADTATGKAVIANCCSGVADNITNATLAAAARTALPELIRRLKRLRESLHTGLIRNGLDDFTDGAKAELRDLIHGEL